MPNGRRIRAGWAALWLTCASPWLAGGCTGRPGRAHAGVAVEQPGTLELQPHTPVPDVPFTLQDGFQLRLPMMKGKLIAVFFCGSPDDPSCQQEADGLAAHHAELHDQHMIVIVGVSPAAPAAHKAFLSARQSPLDFASDADGRIARAFGLAGARDELRMVVVARDGTIHAVWRGAAPERHVRDLLAAAG